MFGESRRGMQWRNGGTFADYVSVPQDLLALKPGNITSPAFTSAHGVYAAGDLVARAQQLIVAAASGAQAAISIQEDLSAEDFG